MNKRIHTDFLTLEQKIDAIIFDFDTRGEVFVNQDRNVLKSFNLNGETVIIKSFKVPNIINQITYKFFRKSKAQRSFTYANILIEKGIGTPRPIAYYEFSTLFLFKKSYYVSAHQDYDLTYRELTTDLSYPEHETILRAFTRFTYDMHEKGIRFLDHSPGNTLICKTEHGYAFYLVDLNRMDFGPMELEDRIKNFARLTTHKRMVEVMSDEYAKCMGVSNQDVFEIMWKETQAFQEKYHNKIKLKKKLKFWKRI